MWSRRNERRAVRDHRQRACPLSVAQALGDDPTRHGLFQLLVCHMSLCSSSSCLYLSEFNFQSTVSVSCLSSSCLHLSVESSQLLRSNAGACAARCLQAMDSAPSSGRNAASARQRSDLSPRHVSFILIRCPTKACIMSHLSVL